MTCIPQIYCIATEKNQRDDMEDRHIVAQIVLPRKDTIDFFAVFDGHHGPEVAIELLTLFPDTLAEKLDALKNIHNPNAICRALYDTFLDVDLKLYRAGTFFNGSTATVVLRTHGDSYLYIGNLGDSRTIVCTGDTLILETVDHKTILEKERIITSGGIIKNNRLDGIMDISRGFGDYTENLKLLHNQYLGIDAPLSSKPDIYMLNLSKWPGPIKLVMASYGLWDVFSNTQVVKHFETENCKQIISQAKSNGSTDNITVMVINILRC